MQTLIRATVMLASLAAGVWALVVYGPEESVQPIARRAIEMADEWLGRASRNDLADDPGGPLPGIPLPGSMPTTLPGNVPATRLVAEPEASHMSMVSPPPLAALANVSELPGAIDTLDNSASAHNGITYPGGGEKLTKLLDPLVALGIQNLKIVPWGRDGQLHRVSCEMPIGHQSGMARHLEAVAAQPAAAVADLLQQVEGWRQRDPTLARLR